MAKKNASKQKKMQTRVDFTPMVDMMMLLITFFMLCTSLSKPQTLKLTMPSNDKNISKDDQNEAKASQSITVYIGDKDQIFYGEGVPKYDDPTWLHKTSWAKDGIRKELRYHKVEDGTMPVDEIMKAKAELDKQAEANKKKYDTVGEDGETLYQKELAELLKGNVNGQKLATLTVVIKPTDNSSFKNLIDALDEIQICSIGTYVIDKVTPEEEAMLAKNGMK